MFTKVLIANRGEIACRVLRTLKRLGIGSVAVYSDADRYAPHVLHADDVVRLGPAPVGESYLRQDAIIEAAQRTGAQAIHPGYGFLSENAAFAERCAAAGIVFVGPAPEQIREFGLKHTARAVAQRAQVPLLPGTELLPDVEAARAAAARIGYPVMLKSTAGGGGIGMQRVHTPEALAAAYESVERLARRNFGSSGVYLERFIENARHIEVQVFGDGRGGVLALGERDCSAQRRNQKVLEETPAPGITATQRAQLLEHATRLCAAVQYRSAGTVEFVFDANSGEFYFLEVNTRLQVEHGVTEEVTGVDLVEWMLRVAAGETLELRIPKPVGASIQARIYAEDPARGFRPSTGLLTEAEFPPDARIETWVARGTTVTPDYDPLLAKIIVSGRDRPHALTKLRAALEQTRLAGIETNLGYLRQLATAGDFVTGTMTTRTLDRFPYAPRTVEVVTPGTQTTVQDYPGRKGYWAVGVPPSGPMDSLSFRLANRALGNAADAAALEITMSGPTLRFNAAITICLTGAAMSATLDAVPVPFWEPIDVPAGATLAIGAASAGCRAYLAVSGGLDVPKYLGSRATFTLGKFGGHGGRALLAGDVLHIHKSDDIDARASMLVPSEVRPGIARDWTLGVLEGPHAAPDFFTAEDIEVFFDSTWTVHYNSSRTGIRLIGPKPGWARSDGGEAGLHPSNIHDNAYAIGAVDFTGDMPVILGPDGPSLGGFVCPATLASAELWKLGQLRADDRVRFVRIDIDEARDLEARTEKQIATLSAALPPVAVLRGPRNASVVDSRMGVLAARAPREGRPEVTYRRSGDCNLLVEFGPIVLDIELRMHVHSLMTALEHAQIPGVIELTPGIRSLQVHFDPRTLPVDELLERLIDFEDRRAPIEALEVPSRTVHLPLSWDDEATQLAISKYMQSVRADAPWCPSNIEFIRRINGLASVEDVKQIVFNARYLVYGLGDVYLGAPVATPIDPRHRLVTTKYNPARTWTPENAVGIGGAYLCVYGMEGPGGYQFVGRTSQVWNTWRATEQFSAEQPWLLRFFDQIRFYPVSAAELLEFRADVLHGAAHVRIDEGTFRLSEHRLFLEAHAPDIGRHKARQQRAFEEERARWAATGQNVVHAEADTVSSVEDTMDISPDCVAIASPVAGNIWRIATAVGQSVRAGDPILIVESMKMELTVSAPADGVLVELRCAEGRAVQFSQTLAVLRASV